MEICQGPPIGGEGRSRPARFLKSMAPLLLRFTSSLLPEEAIWAVRGLPQDWCKLRTGTFTGQPSRVAPTITAATVVAPYSPLVQRQRRYRGPRLTLAIKL